jgi:uncharacterized protein (TIGR03083 family)
MEDSTRMSMPAVDRAPLHEALQTVAGRIAGMIRELPDTTVPIPRSDWTVGEAAAHLAVTNEWAVALFTGEEDMKYGDGTLQSLSVANAHHLSEFQDRDGSRLADLIVSRTEAFVQTASTLPSNRMFQTPMGRIDTATATSYILTHLMIHGSAIAKALNKPYPIDPVHLELALPFLRYVMPSLLDKRAAGRLKACFDLRLRGGSSFAVVVQDGEAIVESIPSRRVDCHISADPVAFSCWQWGWRVSGRSLPVAS